MTGKNDGAVQGAPERGGRRAPPGGGKSGGKSAAGLAPAPGRQLVMDVLGAEPPARRKRGRPPGPGKRKQALQKWLLGLGYTHPARKLAAIMDADTDDLARALGCKRLEALQEQRRAASDLLPYFEGRILPKTDAGEQPLPRFHFHFGDDQVSLGGARPGAGGDDGPLMLGQKIEENQLVEYAESGPSHDGASHDGEKASENREIDD